MIRSSLWPAPRRRLCFTFSSLLFGVSVVVSGQAAAVAEPPLRAGFAQEEITPEIGDRPVWMAGFGHNRRATGVHDPLWARAVVLDAGGRRIALVSVDLVGLFRESVERIRAKLDGFDYVLVSSTHVHEGPDTMGLWGPNAATSGVDREYLARVETQAAAAVRAAAAKLELADAAFGAARDESLVADGREPLVKDDELRVLVFRKPPNASLGSSPDRSPAGMLVQWNCHPETLGSKNTLISSDFPHFTRQYLEKRFVCPVAFFSGDIGGMMTSLGLEVHDAAGEKLLENSFEKTERLGELIGQLAERAAADAKPIQLTPFTIRSRRLYLPQDNLGYTALFTLGVVDRKSFRWDATPDTATPHAGRVPTGRMAIETEIGVLRLGELTAVAVPGELYPELAVGPIQNPQDSAADFPDAVKEPTIFESIGAGKKKLIFGLANDEIGYIIPKSQWDVQPPFCYGRKKAQYGESNSLGPETAPILLQAIQMLLEELPN